jgi:hypothetical protein
LVEHVVVVVVVVVVGGGVGGADISPSDEGGVRPETGAKAGVIHAAVTLVNTPAAAEQPLRV